MKRVVLRLVAFVAVAVVAGGAGPGATGSCSDTSKAIDWNEFCQAKYWAFCLKWDEALTRDPAAPNPVPGVCERTGDMRMDGISLVCGGTPVPCNGPTDLQGEACVEAIYRRGSVSNPEDLPSECLLCGGS
jgi:hypothetical protein